MRHWNEKVYILRLYGLDLDAFFRRFWRQFQPLWRQEKFWWITPVFISFSLLVGFFLITSGPDSVAAVAPECSAAAVEPESMGTVEPIWLARLASATMLAHSVRYRASIIATVFIRVKYGLVTCSPSYFLSHQNGTFLYLWTFIMKLNEILWRSLVMRTLKKERFL